MQCGETICCLFPCRPTRFSWRAFFLSCDWANKARTWATSLSRPWHRPLLNRSRNQGLDWSCWGEPTTPSLQASLVRSRPSRCPHARWSASTRECFDCTTWSHLTWAGIIWRLCRATSAAFRVCANYDCRIITWRMSPLVSAPVHSAAHWTCSTWVAIDSRCWGKSSVVSRRLLLWS